MNISCACSSQGDRGKGLSQDGREGPPGKYMFYILQWNARSLIANGQEFKSFLDVFKDKPELLCVQETWLKPCLDFVVPG